MISHSRERFASTDASAFNFYSHIWTPFCYSSFWMLTLANKLTKDLLTPWLWGEIWCIRQKLSQRRWLWQIQLAEVCGHNSSLDLWSWLHAFIKCHKKKEEQEHHFFSTLWHILFVPNQNYGSGKKNPICNYINSSSRTPHFPLPWWKPTIFCQVLGDITFFRIYFSTTGTTQSRAFFVSGVFFSFFKIFVTSTKGFRNMKLWRIEIDVKRT